MFLNFPDVFHLFFLGNNRSRSGQEVLTSAGYSLTQLEKALQEVRGSKKVDSQTGAGGSRSRLGGLGHFWLWVKTLGTCLGMITIQK